MLNIEWIEKILTVPKEDGWQRKLVVSIRVFIISINRFIVDDCLMHASGIAYTTIVSLVPMLTVALALLTITSGVSSQKEIINNQIENFLIKYELNIDINPYLETLHDIVNAAMQIGAVGFVVLIFSATAVLRTVESSFNSIWKVSSSRSFFNKIIFYFFIMSIGPLLFVVALGYVSKMSTYLRKPHLNSIALANDNTIWISGEKGSLFKYKQDQSNQSINQLKADFENMKCYNSKGVLISVCVQPNLSNENYIKVLTHNNYVFAISDAGIFLYSNNSTQIWTINYFVNTKFKDFAVLDENTILFVTESGDLLKLTLYDKKVISLKEYLGLDFNSEYILFYSPKNGTIIDTNGYMWNTEDGAESFEDIKLYFQKENIDVVSNSMIKNIRDITLVSTKTAIAVGERGLITITRDGGNTWADISHKKISYRKVWNIRQNNELHLLILDDLGNLYLSKDLGLKWSVVYNSNKGRLISLLSLTRQALISGLMPNDESEPNLNTNPTKPSGLLAIGEFNRILQGEYKDGELIWTEIQGGDSILSIYAILNMIIPLAVIWLFFMSLYYMIPNVVVPFKAASIGAVVTGFILLLFLWIFAVYVRSFSTTTIIVYRALAAIPIFLLSIYCLSIIVLFGAEVTATIHHKERYLLPIRFSSLQVDTVDYKFFKFIKFLIEVYRSQNQKKPLKIENLESVMRISGVEFAMIREKLIESNYISINSESMVLPNYRSDDVNLYDLFLISHNESFSLPFHEEMHEYSKRIKTEFSKLDKSIKDELNLVKLSDLLK